jgi:DNA-binding NarL/FixJ family response regulator
MARLEVYRAAIRARLYTDTCPLSAEPPAADVPAPELAQPVWHFGPDGLARLAAYLAAIQAGGELLLGAGVAQRVLQQFAGVRPGDRATRLPDRSAAGGALDESTLRETEVLQLIAQGRRNREIAEHLVISEKTVNHHVSNIFTKVQVADRAQAIVPAREAGLGQRGV